MCCSNRTWRLSWDRFWQKMSLGFTGEGPSWWQAVLDLGLHLCQKVWIMFLVMVGEGTAISVHVWWDFDRFCSFHPESRRCTCRAQSGSFANEKLNRDMFTSEEIDRDQDSEDGSLLGDLEAVTFTPSFCRNCATVSAVLQLWGVGTLESFFDQSLWIHALMNNHAQFRNPSQGFGLLQTEHEKPWHFWIDQIFCKVGVCFDLIDSRHKEQTWWVPSVASRYWVQMSVHADISNPILFFDLHLSRLAYVKTCQRHDL